MHVALYLLALLGLYIGIEHFEVARSDTKLNVGLWTVFLDRTLSNGSTHGVIVSKGGKKSGFANMDRDNGIGGVDGLGLSVDQAARQHNGKEQ